MFRKLTVWAVLVIYLTVMAAPAALAQESGGKISQEQALEIAKKAFDIPADSKNMDVGYREEDIAGKKIWDFNWSIQKYNYYRHFSVAVDADTGEILNYYASENRDPNKKVKQPKAMTREAALEIAKAVAAKLQPKRFGQLQLSKEDQPRYSDFYGPKQYGFSFVRLVNGVIFPENAIRITINAHTGKVTNYQFSWSDDVNFPAPEKVISKEEAEKIFRAQIGLSLRYSRWYGPYPARPGEKEIPLYYSYTESYYGGGAVIDAFGGKVVDSQGKEKVVQKVYVLPATGDITTGQTKEGKKVTMEEAKKLARELVKIPSDYVLQHSSFREGWGPNNSSRIYEMQFGPENYWGGGGLSVGIDAETGELRHFNKFDNGSYYEGNNREVKYDWRTCQQIATDFVKKTAPQKLAEVKIFEQEPPVYYYSGPRGKKMTPPSYHFNFTRVVRGIPFDQNNIAVEIDNSTGEVRGFWLNWEDRLKFAAPDLVITEEEALNKLLKASGLRLTYIRKGTADGSPSKEVMLIYTISGEGPKLVNAVTGEVKTYWELENPPAPFRDADGHWAEREIRFLAAAGIISGSGKDFSPDKPVSRAEFISILANAKGLEITKPDKVSYTDIKPGDWFAGAVEAATKAGWVKGEKGKLNPNRPVTRQEMAVMAAKALDEKLTGDFELDFRDKNEIAPWALDAVKLSVEMGLLSGRDGKFAPRAKATKAEAAVYIFKVMERSNSYGFGYRVFG